jgi:hypothetical protein
MVKRFFSTSSQKQVSHAESNLEQRFLRSREKIGYQFLLCDKSKKFKTSFYSN